jgi:hypothetical protein
MEFFKKLFGGGGAPSSQSGDPYGLYLYVQPRGCDEVVRIRINLMNDLSERDEGGYWVHKVVRGTKCFQTAELDVYFSKSRQMTNTEIQGGALVDQAAYEAWLESQANPGG